MTKHLISLLLVVLVSAAAAKVHAQSDTANCSYESAASYSGWGWNPVTAESCPPRTATNVNCDYSSAGLYDGWGWDSVAGTSCPPLVEPTEGEQSQVDDGCDYSAAAENNGWGWNAGAKTACAPLATDESGSSEGGQNTGDGTDTTDTPTAGRPICTMAGADPDGDGYGWEGGQTCLVQTTVDPPADSKKPQCSSALADPDGDGYGWENNRSCVVVADGSTGEPTDTEQLSPSGVIATGAPVYRWPAVANAEAYRLSVKDSAGNGFTHQIDSVAANCQTGTGSCAAKPDLKYFDNFLSWSVSARVDGVYRLTSGPVAFKTPVSANLQPISSNTSACEAYPAMAYDKYVIVNNIWNARAMYRSGWSQTISLDQVAGSPVVPSWEYDWLQESDGGIYDVKSYPEVVYGNKLGVHISGSKAETGLPEKVRDLQEFVVDYSFTHNHNAEVNVALESFFHSSCNITGPCDDVDNRAFEMMIWVQNPTVRTPGDLALTGVMIDNKLWDVYIKPRSNKKYIAFTAQTPQFSGTLNWNRFVDWTVEWTKNNAQALQINQLSTDFCMGAIEIGSEVFNGKGSFTLDRYNITRR